jgi:uncharacterized membrane protein (UPF0127 family)
MKKESVFYRAVFEDSGEVLSGRIQLASGMMSQMIGLMGRHAPEDYDGIWLHRCNGIHTFGMLYPLDVILLDKEYRIRRIILCIKSCRVILPTHGISSVLEFPSGRLILEERFAGRRMNIYSD